MAFVEPHQELQEKERREVEVLLLDYTQWAARMKQRPMFVGRSYRVMFGKSPTTTCDLGGLFLIYVGSRSSWSDKCSEFQYSATKVTPRTIISHHKPPSSTIITHNYLSSAIMNHYSLTIINCCFDICIIRHHLQYRHLPSSNIINYD